MTDKRPAVHIIEFRKGMDHEFINCLANEDLDVTSFPFNETPSPLPDGKHPALVILMVAGESSGALACCRNFRSAYPECSICLIHENLSEWEESVALELGTDAVIKLPAETRRVLAQIRALLRRQGRNDSPNFQLLAGSRTVLFNGRSISFTDAEFELLSILAQYPGTVVSRDTISQHLRGLAYDGRNRTIDLRIARIRQKLGDNPRQPLLIRTVRGEGYLLMDDET